MDTEDEKRLISLVREIMDKWKRRVVGKPEKECSCGITLQQWKFMAVPMSSPKPKRRKQYDYCDIDTGE